MAKSPKTTKTKGAPKETEAPSPSRARALLDPFDVMRSTRQLAPHDPRLNDIRWLIGEALRRVNHRADLGRNPNNEPYRTDRPSTRPQGQPALNAKDKLREAEGIAGPAAWPILQRVVIEGGHLRDCRDMVPEAVTPWRADAVLADHLRVALDAIGPMMGVTGQRAA